MKKMGVILLSGGMDSATVAAYAQKEGYELVAITLHYGQQHNREIDSARAVARLLGIKHNVIDVSFFKKLAWYSALTSPRDFTVPRQRAKGEMASDIPITYVPLRNTFFITMAAAFLESELLNLIERQHHASSDIEAALFIAANAIDYSGYPDCRPEYYTQMTKTLALGSKLGAQYNIPINIHTPLLDKSKADIVRMAVTLKVPLEHTWSCYEGGETPCGQCDSCILRAGGFAEAGYKDPALANTKRTKSW